MTKLTPEDQDRLLLLHSVEEVCEYAATLGIEITPTIVTRARMEGDLAATRISRKFWYSRYNVRAWLRGPTSLPEGFDQ